MQCKNCKFAYVVFFRTNTMYNSVIMHCNIFSRDLQFPPEFESGDGEGMDMQIPNHVYNKLKRHSVKENARHQKLHEKKDQSTAVS